MRTGKPIDPERSKQLRKLLERSLNQMEIYFLSRGDYIVGEGNSDITIADVFGICELTQVVTIGYDIKAGRPRLAAWYERVKSRLQPHFDDVHKTIFSIPVSKV